MLYVIAIIVFIILKNVVKWQMHVTLNFVGYFAMIALSFLNKKTQQNLRQTMKKGISLR